MGTFTTRVGIGHHQGGDFQWSDALVDTGASHSMVPASLLEQLLHLNPEEELVFVLGDGSEQKYGLGEARFKLGTRERTCPVIFGPEDQYLLGATSLQIFNLVVDTNHHRLVPAARLTI